VNCVERPYKLRIEPHRVGLDERKRIVRLRYDIHTYDLEARSTVPDTGPSSTAKKIK